MKKVIIAKHTGRNDDKSIRYWEYGPETNRYIFADESKYAIVETKYGLQLVEVLGIGEVRDEFKADQKVVLFITEESIRPKNISNE